MCGIFGVSGKKGKSINLHKLAILGLYNESRGTDSCGYYYNGNIERGAGNYSNFNVFLADKPLTPGNLKTKIFMGHTRKGNRGGATLANAHPHLIADNYVQTHNGTINNIWELCNKRKVSHNGIQVDSIALANLMVKVGIKDTLESYKGTAALAFTYMDNPEALYLFHGESREVKEGPVLPEKPLYILHQPEGMYYSSMKDALSAINSTPDEAKPLCLKHNRVVEVVNGEFTHNTVIIDRADANIDTYTSPMFPMVQSANSGNNYKLTSGIKQPSLIRINDEKNENDLLNQEKYPKLEENRVDTVFYLKGRYYEVRRAHTNTKQLYSRLMDGEFVINRDRQIVNKELEHLLSATEERYYFITGVMIKDKDTYDNFRDKGIRGHTEDSFISMSMGSKYPIIQLVDVGSHKQNWWYKDGVRVKNDTFGPKFADHKYKIKYGRTKQIY